MMKARSFKSHSPRGKAYFYVCLFLATSFLFLRLVSLSNAAFNGHPVVMPLKHPLTVLEYPSWEKGTAAIVLFASGDGGWGGLEKVIAHALQGRGYAVVGIDSAAYATGDYDLDTLQSDFSKIAESAEASYGAHPPPLIIGGYSMGAGQAIAVAGGPHPPRNLTGLLLVDPCARGRYGLRSSDRMNVLPTGPGTFSMSDFAATMGQVCVVQWHAGHDPIDSRAWLASLTAPHQEFDFPDAGHNYSRGREDFVRQLADSVGWILSSARTQPMPIATRD